jgi:hypothetical protein
MRFGAKSGLARNQSRPDYRCASPQSKQKYFRLFYGVVDFESVRAGFFEFVRKTSEETAQRSV